MNIDITTRYRKRKGISGRFKASEKNKEFWKSWDSAVNTSEKQTDGKVYLGGGRAINHSRKLTIGNGTNKVDYQDYKMKVFNCDRKTKKMYEEYYKTHSYT